MPSVVTPQPMTLNSAPSWAGGAQARFPVEEMCLLAGRGLEQMFDRASQLFCYRLRRTQRGLVLEGLSPRYTVISLLGLQRWAATGHSSPVAVESTLAHLLHRMKEVNRLGDLGLLLWLCALVWPERLKHVYFGLDVCHALNRYSDARQGRTMELAWFLSGLAHATLVRAPGLPDLTDLAGKTFDLLKANQGAEGIFSHLARQGSFAGVIRGRLGSFADQVYPIYALARFAQAYRSPEALETARECAQTICRLQGPLGQWWWHYDSANGRVVGRYPVYSVHQDGMAPLALFALGENLGTDYGPWILRGLNWISGENEVKQNLRETSAGVIWRSVFRKPSERYWEEAIGLLGFGGNDKPPSDLAIRFECRPYHLGWLLYAFANH